MKLCLIGRTERRGSTAGQTARRGASPLKTPGGRMGIFSRQAVIKMPEPSREARYALATAEVEDSKQQIEVLGESIAQFNRTFKLVQGPWRTIQHVELPSVSCCATLAAD